VTHRNDQRDDQILRHLALYRISFRAVLSRQFFGGGNPGNVITRLLAEGRIQSREGLPQRLRYYQLTAAEAARLGVPLGRTRAPKPQAFLTHLGAVWHCCVDPGVQDRRRLERNELAHLFGDNPPKGAHIIQSVPTPRVFRILVSGPATPARTIFKSLRKRIEAARRSTILAPWLKKHQYAFLVLLEGESRIARVQELIKTNGIDQRAVIDLRHAPDHRTAAHSLRGAERRPRRAGSGHGRPRR
jgi:hypothetical protein